MGLFEFPPPPGAPGSCCLWSRLAADGPAAAQQLCDVAEGAEDEAVPEVLELLLEQLEARRNQGISPGNGD